MHLSKKVELGNADFQSEKTVLLVDDNKELLALLVKKFKMSGFNVLSVSNVKEALSILDAAPEIAAIVCDVRMPNQTGVDFFQKVTRRQAARPVFMFMTGYPIITIEGAAKMGADGYFEKPFHMDVLIEAVIKAIKDKEGQVAKVS